MRRGQADIERPIEGPSLRASAGSTYSVNGGIGYALEIVSQRAQRMGGPPELMHRLEELESEGRLLIERTVDVPEGELRPVQGRPRRVRGVADRSEQRIGLGVELGREASHVLD